MNSEVENLKKTSLFEEHKMLGAKLVAFGGWNMPISYEGVLAEHHAVRTACGIFDVSHMGEVRVRGRDAEKYLQKIFTNNLQLIQPGFGQYSAMLNTKGGFVDDLIVYKLASDEFFVCINASNVAKDFDWMLKQKSEFDVQVVNESDMWSQIAIQGPQSKKLLSEVLKTSTELAKVEAATYTQIVPVRYQGVEILVARTGYTGEIGFEVYTPNKVAVPLWKSLMSSTTIKVTPIGLGARDTLRLEACYLLYGNDMDETVNPLEAGIAWAVKLDKGDFLGKNVLIEQKEKGVPRATVAFVMKDSGIPRHGMEVFTTQGELLGKVSSGGVLPTVGGAGGMALIRNNTLKIGGEFLVDIRGKRKLACVVKRPLYSAKVKG